MIMVLILMVKWRKSSEQKIIKMNRNLGTTIILTAPSDINIKYFASVLIFFRSCVAIYGKLDPVVYDLPIKTDPIQKKGEIVRAIIENNKGQIVFATCTVK